MKHQLLILCLLAGFVICVDVKKNSIKVQDTADGIVLTCEGKMKDGDKEEDELKLSYHDNNSKQYICSDNSKIYVKFRTCDNCVELDTPSMAGLVVGDVIATIVVGVAVYLIASQARTGQVKSTKKKSDKQSLISNQPTDDVNYQPLVHKKGGRSEYDVINKK